MRNTEIGGILGQNQLLLSENISIRTRNLKLFYREWMIIYFRLILLLKGLATMHLILF